MVKVKFYRQKIGWASEGLQIPAMWIRPPESAVCHSPLRFLKAVFSRLTILHRNGVLFWIDTWMGALMHATNQGVLPSEAFSWLEAHLPTKLWSYPVLNASSSHDSLMMRHRVSGPLWTITASAQGRNSMPLKYVLENFWMVQWEGGSLRVSTERALLLKEMVKVGSYLLAMLHVPEIQRVSGSSSQNFFLVVGGVPLHLHFAKCKLTCNCKLYKNRAKSTVTQNQTFSLGRNLNCY